MRKITLKIFLLLLAITSLSISVFAQTDEESEPSELHLFRGGYLDINFGLNINTVGSSLGSGSMGGLISSRVKNGALNIHLNPAMLGFMTEGQFLFDSRFGIGTAMTSGINSSLSSTINDELESSVNDEFSNEDSWTQFPETYISATQVRDFDIGFRNNVTSAAFAAPISDKLVLAGAYSYPASIDFDLGLTGLSAKLAQEQGTDEVAIRFDVLMNVSLLTRMSFQMSTLSLGMGRVLIDERTKKLAVGGTLTRYQVNSTRRLQADLSGLVVVGGADERYFNNPDDPNLNTQEGESNSFFMNANGTFQANEYGVKLGAYYELDQAFRLSMVYNQVPNFDLKSENSTASAFLPVFLVGSGDDILGGDIEVALDSLQANKPNLTTERDISSLVDDGRLNLPSSLTFGLDIVLKQHTLVLNYSRYFSELSFTNGDQTLGKELTSGVGVGFDFRMRDRYNSVPHFIVSLPLRLLFLDIDGLLFQTFGGLTGYKNSHYRFGGNVVFGEGIVTSDNESMKSNLDGVIPQSFSMGRQYTIFENIDVGVTVLAVPDLLLKYSVGIRF